MGLEEVAWIKEFFSKNNISVTYLEHEPVVTSADAAKTRGFELKQGVKAIVLTNDSGWVVVAVPADKKVDVKKVAEVLGWSKGKVRMASPEEVLQKTGCEVGAVPPFLHKETVPLLVDKRVFDNEENAFNIGLRTVSVKIKTVDLRKVFSGMNVVEGMFTK